jgi:hypothetical protein
METEEVPPEDTTSKDLPSPITIQSPLEEVQHCLENCIETLRHISLTLYEFEEESHSIIYDKL